MKMYQAEVLEKHTVVQHFYFGEILPWKRRGTGEPLPTRIEVAEEGEGNDDDFVVGQPGATKAPWVDAGDEHPVSTTVAPWTAMSTGTLPVTAAPWASATPGPPYSGSPAPHRGLHAGHTQASVRQPTRQAGRTLAQTGSAAAMSSPLGVISQPVIGNASNKPSDAKLPKS